MSLRDIKIKLIDLFLNKFFKFAMFQRGEVQDSIADYVGTRTLRNQDERRKHRLPGYQSVAPGAGFPGKQSVSSHVLSTSAD